MKNIACVILNYNDYRTTINLVKRIKDYKIFDKILIVDNKSTNDSFKKIKEKFLNENKIVVISSPKNGGYGYGNNFGVNYAYAHFKSKYVVISNPDVSFTNDAVKKLIDVAENTNAAIVSGVQNINRIAIKDKAWKIPSAFESVFLNTKFSEFFKKDIYYPEKYFNSELSEVECVPGAMFLLDVNKFLKVGGYDEDFFLYYEETCLGIKLKRKSFKTFLVNDVKYDHLHSVSIDQSIPQISKQYLLLNKSKDILMKKYLGAGKLTRTFSNVLFKINLKIIKHKK